MNKKYSAGTITKIIFSLIILVLLFGPFSASLLYDMSSDDFIIVNVVLYAGFSPLIICMAVFYRKYLSCYIILNPQGIELKYRRFKEIIPWDKIESIYFNYTILDGSNGSASRKSIIYEVNYGDKKFRFNCLMNNRDIKDMDNISVINPFQKKAFSFESYGLFLSRQICSELVKNIEMLSGISAERFPDLF